MYKVVRHRYKDGAAATYSCFIQQSKRKRKAHPRTGHEGPEGE
jgi:hypothetical protein